MIKRLLARTLTRTPVYRYYDRYLRRFDYRTIEFFLHRYSRHRRSCSFIQVGANDGITWDPYHHFITRDGWTGIVIEPQSEVFAKLEQTYESVSRVRLMNVAIDRSDGSRALYRYAFSASRWATGLASFDKERLIDSLMTDYVQNNMRAEGVAMGGDPESYIVSEDVPCISFETLLREINWTSLDFLITDVEGFDVEILDSFPLSRLQPMNIVFELPAAPDAALQAFLQKLKAHRYHILIAGNDAIAVRMT